MATDNLAKNTANVTVNQEERPQERQPARSVNWYRPAVDVYENQDGLHLFMDIPGVKPDALEVNVEGRILTVQGVRSYGNTGWRRQFNLPDGLDTERIAAKAEHGVLKLDIPITEARKPRRIEVR
jgi:HSP20 family molecular chaperone IbpA